MTTGADDYGPRLEVTRRKLVVALAFIGLAVVALYFLLPHLSGLHDTWARLRHGSTAWLVVALLFTVGQFAGYVLIFLAVFGDGSERVGVRESYVISLAALAATRLLSAGGAGGVALQAWALRRAGMEPQEVADRTVTFLVLTYVVYTSALAIFGLALWFGVLPGPAPLAMTLLPALLAIAVTVAGFSLGLVPPDLGDRVRSSKLLARLALIPGTASAGMRKAVALLRRGDRSIIGAVAFWAFQIATLWACFEAFGGAPTLGVLVVGFYVGMLGNLLPLPGGIGGVDGGMIGAFVALQIPSGLAIVAVLAFRAFTFWLPTLPGVIAYVQLRKIVERWRTQRNAAATAGT